MPHTPPVFANLPTTSSAMEARLFRKIHARYCAGPAAHACVGRITIDRLGMTFNCPRCGDARCLYPEAGDQGSGISNQGAGAR